MIKIFKQIIIQILVGLFFGFTSGLILGLIEERGEIAHAHQIVPLSIVIGMLGLMGGAGLGLIIGLIYYKSDKNPFVKSIFAGIIAGLMVYTWFKF